MPLTPLEIALAKIWANGLVITAAVGLSLALVVEQLLGANPLHLGPWVQALEPVRDALLGRLSEVFRDPKRPEYRVVARSNEPQ